MQEVGEDNPKAVIATTILAFSISSVITGLVFFLLGALNLGALIGFFPRHILVGCIGGVGLFLFLTGIEVSARLEGNLSYSLTTLKALFRTDTLPLWITPLAIATFLMVIQRKWSHPLIVPIYFMFVPIVFYCVILCIPNLGVEDLRRLGWIFEAPEANQPWWHFYTLYGNRVLESANVRFQGNKLERFSASGPSNAGVDFLRHLTCSHQRSRSRRFDR
jgi:sulfate permease, SulP family